MCFADQLFWSYLILTDNNGQDFEASRMVS